MPVEPITTSETGLLPFVKEAFKTSGWTQAQAAKELGVAQGSISKALSDSTGRYSQLQARLISAVPGWHCEGPSWRITKP